MRRDCATLVTLLSKVTGEPAVMWGPSIVGFGTCHYVYASGRSGDWMLTGFSPRKQNLTIYLMSGFDAHGSLLKTLGRYTTGKSCLYVRSLADVDLGVLEKLARASVAQTRKAYPAAGAAKHAKAKSTTVRKVAKKTGARKKTAKRSGTKRAKR